MPNPKNRVGINPRICVINPNFYRSSGVTVAIKRIWAGLAEQSAECFFVDCDYGQGASDEEWIPTGRLVTLRLMGFNPYYIIQEFIKLIRFLTQAQIDVVHVHHRRLAVLASLASLFSGARVVYTGQLTYSDSFLFKTARFDAYVAISESVVQNLLETTWAAKIDKISNPVDFRGNSAKAQLGTVTLNVCCIARFAPVKNHRNLLLAWSICCRRHKKAVLYLVGEGELKKELIELVDDLKISPNVVFCGYQTESGVIAVIEKCSFLILTSFREGQGIVSLEGASCKRASLLTDVDGSRDIIPPEAKLPNRLNPYDIDGMASGIDYWLDNPLDVLKEGEVFYAHWVDRASIQGVATRYLNLYKRISRCVPTQVV